MSPYILSCMLSVTLNPAQHPVPWECEQLTYRWSGARTRNAPSRSKWEPVCYTPIRLAAEASACQSTDFIGTERNLLWLLEAE